MKSREQKRIEATARQAEYDKLSLGQKFHRAIDRRGLSMKEIGRLTARLAKEQT